MTLEQALNDHFRVNYYRSYLTEAAAAVRDSGVPLIGYIAWSFEDNFEWADGYAYRFGITHVNYSTQKRHSKASAVWFSSLISLARQGTSAGAPRSIAMWPSLWLTLVFIGIVAPFGAVGICYTMASPTSRSSQDKTSKEAVPLMPLMPTEQPCMSTVVA